ncbi:MAG: UvrD-helicase domain-containing protein, partial [Winogradskyella sp.]|nr:UvrD-helicase domain-containing protein [Winogradskyella sp.]
KQTLNTEIQQLEAKLISDAKKALTLIEECGLRDDNFSRKSVPNHFLKLSRNNDVSFDSVWQGKLIDGEPLYPKRVDDSTASTIDSIQPQLIEYYLLTKELVFDLKLKVSLRKHITPLSVINAIQNELKTLKEEQNKLLISEFNTIISNEIRDQPTPFIYERLGERYRYFFIDEFQDTSILQWSNLQPLIDNSLSSNVGSLMLVGDAKQAIYRWRGGDADQFLKLIEKSSQPFVIEPKVEQLDTNYRSLKEVITFNNSLFTFIANHCFDHSPYQHLYRDYCQKNNKNDHGHVTLKFLDIANVEEADDLYPEAVYNKITTCTSQGFEYGDICILVRKRKQAVAISKFLNSKGLEINSAETLLLNNSEKVVFVLNVLYLLVEPANKKNKVNVLSFIADWLKMNDPHEYIYENLNSSIHQIFKDLQLFNITLDTENVLQLTLFDLTETIIRSFNLINKSDAYLQYLLDQILDFTKHNPGDIMSFLSYFEEHKHKLSIVSPQNINAVKIMTIHQSKGLEFPVVIYAYADTDIYEDIEPKVWFNIEEQHYNGFSSSLVSVNKDLQNFNDQGDVLYHQYRSKLELDSVNLLYVALTRAEQQLHILSKKDFKQNGQLNESSYASYFIKYLNDKNLWEDSKADYSFGYPEKIISETESEQTKPLGLKFISQSKESHQLKIISNKGLLWDTKQEQAIERGNLVHLILSKIKTAADVDFVMSEFITTGELNTLEANELLQLIIGTINHAQLQPYFNDSMQIFNEKEIIDNKGLIYRLDRLVITPDDKAVIIDYKTGSEKSEDKRQILRYTQLIQEMGYTIKESLLVYINDDIKVVKVS